MIISALVESNFSVNTIVDNSYPALTAILYIFLLLIAVGIMICLYIIFIIIPAFKYKNKKQTAAIPQNKKEQKSKKLIIFFIISLIIIIAGLILYLFMFQKDLIMSFIS